MVTSNKLPEKKIVNMADQNNSVVIPQRTLLGEVNEYITCPLCRGYYIDATTIVECLHSFCRSCIIKHLQVKSYCPVCEMMINSAKPNIKLDKALQDIVYKLVPGLFQKEMERRQKFYASRPGPAASATPEQRGEDTERIIFSPEDVISFSLEYADATDTDSISSKSSDSNDQPSSANRRFLQCPAVVNISHLKKFLSMKFDVDSTQFAIDILYKRVPLPDYYTLMDIAYIYNWKRNEPMRFFYQIIDYVAIRNRLFDINRKGSNFHDRKSSPALTEDTNASSPAPNMHDQGSEASSGTDSPMPDDSGMKKSCDNLKSNDKSEQQCVDVKNSIASNKATGSTITPKKNDDEVEKSQFLNSFELTAKNAAQEKCSPSKVKSSEDSSITSENATNAQILTTKKQATPPKTQAQATPPKPKSEIKTDDSLKRKSQNPTNMPEIKKLRIELEKAKLLPNMNTSLKVDKSNTDSISTNNTDNTLKSPLGSTPSATSASKEIKPVMPSIKQSITDISGSKRVTGPHSVSSPKQKTATEAQNQPVAQKTVSPLKLQIPKVETPKLNETNKPPPKKIPDLKPTTASQPKGPSVNRVRMDLLANNCDPTIDRSKILSQVKTSLTAQNSGQSSGDPLKSLFDSCKINIPSSLSITLTDQKLEERPAETANDPKKMAVNKNLSANAPGAHNTPSPPVHNYIEILKLPDAEPKKSQSKVEGNNETKTIPPTKMDGPAPNTSKPNSKPETSAKGPVPNLKPISDTKLAKTGNYSAPITFQQTFEKQLQSLQSDKKPKLPKAKAQVPKLVPATPKSFSVANKLNNPSSKPAAPISGNVSSGETTKTGTALDLSTPHNIQSQLGPQQSKAFETMQSIANLAKKQNLSQKPLPPNLSQSNAYSNVANRPLGGPGLMRVPAPTNINQIKLDKINQSGLHPNTRNDITKTNQSMKPGSSSSPIVSSPGYQMPPHNSPNTTQPSPRSTRSPSSSPKLVIAEEKQSTGPMIDPNANQSNQISSTQLQNQLQKSESPKPTPGPSKPGLKQKPIMPGGKPAAVRQPITPNMKPQSPTLNAPTDFLSQPQLLAHHALLRHQMEMQNAWLKAQRQYDLFKNMSSMAHQNQNDFNNKDKM